MNWLRRAIAMLLPWPSRQQRQAAIATAQRQKQDSRAGAVHAASVEQAIRRMAAENHFAATIADQIARRHRGD